MQVERRGVHPRSVVGVFDHQADAERALGALRDMGIGGDEVSVMMRDSKVEQAEADTGGSPVAGAAASGAALGGLLGGLAGWMVAIGAIGVPVLGTVVGAGALAAMLTGIALGAAAGGLVGALLGLGVPEDEARQYESHVREGRVLVTVHPSSSVDAAQAQQVLQTNGAYDVRVYEAPPVRVRQGEAATGTQQAEAEASVQEAEVANEGVPPTAGLETILMPAAGSKTDSTVGELSAESDELGRVAEGGYGTGEVPAQEAPDAGYMSDTAPGVDRGTSNVEGPASEGQPLEPDRG